MFYRTEVRRDGELVFASDRLNVREAQEDAYRNATTGHRGIAITTNAPVVSPFVRRALANELPGKVVGR